jgi:hypothetical protein
VSEDVELLLELRLRRPFALQLLAELRSTGFRIAELVLEEGEGLFG